MLQCVPNWYGRPVEALHQGVNATYLICRGRRGGWQPQILSVLRGDWARRRLLLSRPSGGRDRAIRHLVMTHEPRSQDLTIHGSPGVRDRHLVGLRVGPSWAFWSRN